MNCGSQMPHSCFAASKRRVLEREEDGGWRSNRPAGGLVSIKYPQKEYLGCPFWVSFRPDQHKITRKRNTRCAHFGCHSGRNSIK